MLGSTHINLSLQSATQFSFGSLCLSFCHSLAVLHLKKRPAWVALDDESNEWLLAVSLKRSRATFRVSHDHAGPPVPVRCWSFLAWLRRPIGGSPCRGCGSKFRGLRDPAKSGPGGTTLPLVSPSVNSSRILCETRPKGRSAFDGCNNRFSGCCPSPRQSPCRPGSQARVRAAVILLGPINGPERNQ